jgi:glycosyltransferase involved in cell wall biosynthesis
LTEHGTQQAGQVTLSLVVPVFNEEDSLDTFLRRINEVFQPQVSIDLELVFVNDGSTDATLERLLEHQRQDVRLRIVDLWSGHDDFLEHKRRYTLAQFETLVRDAGLTVQRGACISLRCFLLRRLALVAARRASPTAALAAQASSRPYAASNCH